MAATALTHYDIDAVLADSFPASDPPAWTLGVARPTPELVRRGARAVASDDAARSHRRGEPSGGQ